MKLRPQCGWCQSYENFIPNRLLVSLVQCYSKLCQFVLSSEEYQRQVEYAINNLTPELESCRDKLENLLKEGINNASYVAAITSANTSAIPLESDISTADSSKRFLKSRKGKYSISRRKRKMSSKQLENNVFSSGDEDAPLENLSASQEIVAGEVEHSADRCSSSSFY